MVVGTEGIDISRHIEVPSQRLPTGLGRDMPTPICHRRQNQSYGVAAGAAQIMGLLVMGGREVQAGHRCASKVSSRRLSHSVEHLSNQRARHSASTQAHFPGA